MTEKEELVVYDEYYEAEKLIEDNASSIKLMTAGDRVEWTMIDPSTENRNPKDKTSIRQDYARFGLQTRAKRTDKIQGIDRIKRMLKIDPDTRRPKLMFFKTCYNTIKEIRRYRHKDFRTKEMQDKSNDTVKIHDHAMDALRYMIMGNPNYNIRSRDSLPERKNWYGGGRNGRG